MLPPEVEPKWEDNNAIVKAKILAFHQLQLHDEAKRWGSD